MRGNCLHLLRIQMSSEYVVGSGSDTDRWSFPITYYIHLHKNPFLIVCLMMMQRFILLFALHSFCRWPYSSFYYSCCTLRERETIECEMKCKTIFNHEAMKLFECKRHRKENKERKKSEKCNCKRDVCSSFPTNK